MELTDRLKKEIVYSDSPERLYELMIEVNEYIADLYLQLAGTKESLQRVSLKGKITVGSALLTIIDNRIDEVKANACDKMRREMLANRQFRIVAEAILQRETIDRIKELSLINYRKFKELKPKLVAAPKME